MKKLPLLDDPLINTVPSDQKKPLFLKGLDPRHTAYYLDDFPIPYALASCQAALEKLPTMVAKGTGLSGALRHTLPTKKLHSIIGASTYGGMQQHTNFHTQKNNHFMTGALAYDTDGQWKTVPSNKFATNVQDSINTFEGVFQTGHQDNDQKFTITGLQQYTRNHYCDIWEKAPSDDKTYTRLTRLMGVSYARKDWHVFTSFHNTKEQNQGYPSTDTCTFTAGAHKEAAHYQYGAFTQHINQRIYRYDVYAGRKIGPIYPLVRVIKNERQLLVPWQITVNLSSPLARGSMKQEIDPRLRGDDSLAVTFGSVYSMPTEYQRFNPQYGNFDLKPEHNYHCHVSNTTQIAQWHFSHLFFINMVKDFIDMQAGDKERFQNLGNINSVGIDQAISYDGFDRYKIGFSHAYCILDGYTTLKRRPAWKAVLWQRFYAREHLYFDLQTHWTSSYSDFDRFDYTKKVKMPGALLWNMGATCALNSHWKIIFEIKNLTDKQYENPSGYKAKGLEAWVRLAFDLDGN